MTDPEFITKSSDIPTAAFYVLATDSYLSGWGYAEHRDNVLIVPCCDLRTANDVHAVLKGREEMKRARIVKHRPRLSPYWAAQVKRADDVRGWTGADLPGDWIVDGAAWEALRGGEVEHRTRFDVTPDGFCTAVYEIGWAAGVAEPSGGLAFTGRDAAEKIDHWRTLGYEVRIAWPDGSTRETLPATDGAVAS